ncbi:hypothetical protein SLS53_006212 [Cytospora paraplurivora]|uniref:BTB domain-containing protein n=1 Tax=Cytospora paraplurivora TaxID=2898453 RepID=A0AAN9U497_9PEZI
MNFGEDIRTLRPTQGDHQQEEGKCEKPEDGDGTPKFAPIPIDPNGNLRLIVGEERRVFLVDANALRRSSKVFDAMLFGSFKEAVQDTAWTVELPEDDAWAMQVLLDAVHTNFGKVPKKMGILGLYRITVFTNKYDMTHCLQPWARIWASKADNPLLHKEYRHSCNEDDIERIWVFYELGMYRPFEDLLLSVALDASATPDGDIQIRRYVLQHTKFIKLKDSDVLIDSNVYGQSQEV